MVAIIFLLNIPTINAMIEANILGLFSNSSVPVLPIKIPGKMIAGKIADGT